MQSKGEIAQKCLNRWIEYIIQREKENRAIFLEFLIQADSTQKGLNWDGTHNLPATRLR